MCLSALQVVLRIILGISLVRICILWVLYLCCNWTSIVSLLDVAFFVSSNVISDLLVLLKKKPKHAIEFLGCLDGHFGV